MSTTHCIICLVFLLFLLPLQNEATARKFPFSAPSTAISVETNSAGGAGGAGEYVIMNPQLLNHRKGVPGGRTVRNCMPKGGRRSSAPSRYVNYHPFGSSPCYTGGENHPENP